MPEIKVHPNISSFEVQVCTCLRYYKIYCRKQGKSPSSAHKTQPRRAEQVRRIFVSHPIPLNRQRSVVVDGKVAFQLNKTSSRVSFHSLRYKILVKMYEVCYEFEPSLMKNFCSPLTASEDHCPRQGRMAGMCQEEIPPFCTQEPSENPVGSW